MRLFYSLFFYGVLPVILLRLLWRSIKAPLYRRRWGERFGFVSVERSSSIIWLHTVSVGESIAAKPLALKLLEQYPECQLLITTTTPTGSEQVLRMYDEHVRLGRVLHCYIPYDLPDCVSRFLQRIQPAMAIFMETEVWPNMLAACKKKNISTLLINARLSTKSLKGYQRFGSLSSSAFSQFDIIAAQTQADAERMALLSARKIVVTGSIKSEITIDDDLLQEAVLLKKTWSDSGKKKIIVAASTHQGEDEVLLSVFRQCLDKDSQLLLVIVPRHPERFSQVEKYCIEENFSTHRMTQLSLSDQPLADSAQVIIGDTMGQMMLLLGAADVAIVCGSFIEHGGHNMLEPAAWGIPIISGQHVFNFAKIASDMQQQNALKIAKNSQELYQQLEYLLYDAEAAQSIGDNAKHYVEKNKGALNKTLAIIGDILTSN